MAPGSMCVCLVVGLAHLVFLAQGQTVTCLYADSILVGSTCFRYSSTMVTWADGKAFCAIMNGTLAMVNSSAQMSSALKNMALYNDAWIGANDIDVEGTLIWDHDKSPIGTALTGFWAFGQPSNIFPEYDCVGVYRLSLTTFKTYTADCTVRYGTLCMEMPLPTTTSTTTTTTTLSTTTTTPTTTTTTPTTTTTTTTPSPTTMQITSTTTTATTSTPSSSSLAPATTTTIQSATQTQSTVNTTSSTAAASASTDPSIAQTIATTSKETTPPTTIALKLFMQGGVEPVQITLSLYTLPVSIALLLALTLT